jgi:excisionase family DNA binding protein
MQDLMTTRQLQEVLKVDRTTIYRIVKRGELNAIRVGNQWRFPRHEVESWLNEHALQDGIPTELSATGEGESAEGIELKAGAVSPGPTDPIGIGGSSDVWDSSNAHFIFPIECLQRIQDAFAEILGVTILVTNTGGTELTRSSNPGELWDLARTAPEVRRKYRTFFSGLASIPGPPSKLYPDPVLGLLWSRALINSGGQVRALAAVGGLAPAQWPPNDERVRELALEISLPETTLQGAVDQVHRLDESDTSRLLPFSRRLGDIIEHIVAERVEIVDRMESIAELTRLDS